MITFYGSGFFIAAMILVGAISSKRKLLTFVYLSIGLLISLFLLSPLLYFQALNAKAGLADLKNWSMALGKAELKNVAMIFLKFATGRLSWYPKISYYLIAGIPTAIIWLFALRGALKNRLFALLFVIPLLIGLFISFWAPMMMYFRFLYLVPVMSILIALQIGEPMGKQILKEIRIPIQNQIYRRIRTYIGFIILFFYCAFSFVYLFFSVFHREDWKGLGQHLNINTPVYMILPSSDPVLYYRSDVQIFELRDIKKAEVPETIDVVPYTNEIYGLNHTQLLQEKGCIKESEQHFRGDLILERWKCLRNA